MTTNGRSGARGAWSIAVITCALVLLQGCGAQSGPAAERTFQLSSGGRVTVERTVDHGIEAEKVYEYDQQGQQIAVSWCPQSIASYDQLVSFFGRFQTALSTRNEAAVARLIRYPLAVNGGASESIKSAAMLVQQYERVFPPALTRQILRADVHAVFCTGYGVMISNGAVWATASDGRLAIDVVNR